MGGIGGGSEGDLEGAHIECGGDCEDIFICILIRCDCGGRSAGDPYRRTDSNCFFSVISASSFISCTNS